MALGEVKYNSIQYIQQPYYLKKRTMYLETDESGQILVQFWRKLVSFLKNNCAKLDNLGKLYWYWLETRLFHISDKDFWTTVFFGPETFGPNLLSKWRLGHRNLGQNIFYSSRRAKKFFFGHNVTFIVKLKLTQTSLAQKSLAQTSLP